MLEVGRIAKAHGLNGEVNVVLVSNRPERLDPGSVLSTDRGELTVVSSRRHGERWRRPGHQMRVEIHTADWIAVCFLAPVIETYRQFDRSRHPGFGPMGPDLSRVDADQGYFAEPPTVRVPFAHEDGRPVEAKVEYAYCLVDYQCLFGEATTSAPTQAPQG